MVALCCFCDPWPRVSGRLKGLTTGKRTSTSQPPPCPAGRDVSDAGASCSPNPSTEVIHGLFDSGESTVNLIALVNVATNDLHAPSDVNHVMELVGQRTWQVSASKRARERGLDDRRSILQSIIMIVSRIRRPMYNPSSARVGRATPLPLPVPAKGWLDDPMPTSV